MRIVNASDEPARKSQHETTNKEVDYDSPLPQLLASIDVVCSHIKSISAHSQRLAACVLWHLQKLAAATAPYSNSPRRPPHPRQLDKHFEELAEHELIHGLLSRKRRRSREAAPSNPDVAYHLGGVMRDGDTWTPAPAITEQSEHAELLRGLDNLHSFTRQAASDDPARAKRAVREYGRAIAIILGAAEITAGLQHSSRRPSYSALRNWDILKVPRAPAPGFRLPWKAAPMFDLHSILDTGELQISFEAHVMFTGRLNEYVEAVRKQTDGDEALFQELMEALGFVKGVVRPGAIEWDPRYEHRDPTPISPNSSRKSDPPDP